MAATDKYKSSIVVNGRTYSYIDLKKLDQIKLQALPYAIRVLLECAIRNCDEFQIKTKDVNNILNWPISRSENVEIPFKPSRVLLQDFTGVPAIVDFAAMRDSIAELGGDPKSINPVCPADLVIDHSVQVDVARSADSVIRNQDIEFDRNQERFSFLKWGAENFNNMIIVPPGSGIVHQVNLESLARLVFGADKEGGLLYPDSVVGTDSHTTMINGLGILGWGVGGIEAEAVMLDQPVNLVLPPVTGFKLTGKLKDSVTSTDMVLKITNLLRKIGVVGHFVEFFGPGVAGLSIADRATVANMCPEYGATCGYFPIDERSLEYMAQTGRDADTIAVIREYLIANQLFQDIRKDEDKESLIQFSQTFELDLGTIEPCVAGPKRPQDHVPISKLKTEFDEGLCAPIGFKGFNIPNSESQKSIKFNFYDENAKEHEACLHHGDVVIAAITSCTNTSNPSVMLGAGLLAKNAVKRGLNVKKHIKTSLSPGSGVVTCYLDKSGLSEYLDKLGFNLTGYGCMTCIGNSGPLEENVSKVIEDNNLVVASVLSGNRNFEGRVHPQTRANYLASPPLVIAYALAGTVRIDFEKEPIGNDSHGTPVFLKEIWPTNLEIQELEIKCVLPDMFKDVYSKIKEGGSGRWKSLEVAKVDQYPWDEKSTYIKKPPFFDGLTKELPTLQGIKNARVLLNLGDSITTDHISPAGSIARNSPAARYLGHNGVRAKDFNTYGARRGNDEVMSRGTFANIRLFNKFLNKASPKTVHFPSGDEMDVFDCAERYHNENVPVIILAGKEYGSGSSRDWAAKGPYLLGVRAVIAESFERIHRSNLIGMGIMPLQFIPEGNNADSLHISGKELFSIELPDSFDNLKPGQRLKVRTDCGREFEVLSRFDTEVELEYFRNGGILQFMIRKLLSGA